MKKVLIAGDCIIDHHIYKGGIEYPRKKATAGSEIKEEGGGACLLHRLVQHQCAENKDYQIQFQEVSGFDNHAYAVWKPCRGNHKSEDKCKKSKMVWRVKEMLGYGPSSEIPRPSKTCSKLDDQASWDLVVFDDGGLGYRFHKKLWQPILSQENRADSPWIIMKMSHQVGQGDLWAELCSQDLAQHTVLIVSVDDLRRNEIMITRGRSWEQTIKDILNEFEINVHLQALMQCQHIIAHFGNDGALWIDNSQSEKRKNTLFFDPGGLEGEWDGGIDGTVLGSSTCFTAGIICTLLNHEKDTEKISQGIMNGLCAMRTLRKEGHGPVGGQSGPAFPEQKIDKVLKGNAGSEYRFNQVTIPDVARVKKPGWSILESLSNQQKQRPLYGRARQVALNGVNVLKDIPYGRFGALYSVDHVEIESLNSIRNLIMQYVNSDKGKKPLSLGVFGPPGAGKSFGVKEIAKGILGDKVAFLEFNLSQFDDYPMLIGAFHQVRDKALEEQIPVVFWDEFDSKELKWLQYLLSPMQDGAFLFGLLNAFLKTKEYKHGARSLETLITLMRGGEGEAGLMRSNLPPREQISLHVDYDEFLALVKQGEEFQQTCKDLAPFVHAQYQEKSLTPIEYKQNFDELPANIKADNVAAALRITQVLSLISMQVVPKNDEQVLDPDEVLKEIKNNIDLLAEAEHIGWVDSKKAQGWRAPKQGEEKRSDEDKIHPCLIPYSELYDVDKQKDRDAVVFYPKLVDLAGYMIVYEE